MPRLRFYRHVEDKLTFTFCDSEFHKRDYYERKKQIGEPGKRWSDDETRLKFSGTKYASVSADCYKAK